MAFDSLRYALFLPAVTVAYFGCPDRFRWLFLLTASGYFYTSWDSGFGGALIASTLLTYVAARGMSRGSPDRSRHYWLVLGVAGNLSLLIAFKYLRPFDGMLAPIGISFFTLQAIGYLLDVLRGDSEPESHLGRFASYMAFFPQVVAGPIARSSQLLPQFREPHRPEYERLARGLRQVMWGLFQKVVVANNLGMFVDSVYGDVRLYSGFPLMIATFFFSIQLYCDFAGYSNVALGSARLIGFDLLPNFDRPYLAQNLAEFWRRWHMSLSKWLADNVHKPLALALRSTPKGGLVAAILSTFTLCGLWHGASSTYLAWGILHGVGLTTLALTGRVRRRINFIPNWANAPLSTLATFTFVTLTWVFFRANNLEDAFYAVRHLWAIDTHTLIGVPTISRGTFMKDVALALVPILGDLTATQARRAMELLGPSLYNYCSLVALGVSIYMFGVFEKQVFIYAQF